MATRSLPPRPSLTQLKLQARELQRAHRQGDRPVAARIVAHHPKRKHDSLETVLARPFNLADAQLVVAREYGFHNWADLKHFVETEERLEQVKPHDAFAEALTAFDAGDIDRLGALLRKHPDLVHARTNLEPPYGYFTGATLLHYVAGNPGRGVRLPDNTIEIARLLLESGADANSLTLSQSGATTMGLVITSKQASDRSFSAPLMDLLLAHGAKLDLQDVTAVIPDWRGLSPLDAALQNHARAAAEKLIALDPRVDVCAAAALGRMDLLRASFDEHGKLRQTIRRAGHALPERDAIGLALLYAYVNHHPEAVDFLLEKDGNWNMTGVQNGAVLHRAAWNGDLPMVKRLIAKGADIYNRDNPFNSTPLSWAQHAKQQEVFDWLRLHTAIDLHEAVGYGLREHVEARLREDPASVNKQLDHWELPQSTPLHWAAWPYYDDVDSTHMHDPIERAELVTLLLDRGADPNIIAGNGLTALDIANEAKAEGIVRLLVEHGAKRAADL